MRCGNCESKQFMKISFLLPESGIGGGVRAIMEFANGLLSLGHAVRIMYKKRQSCFFLKRLYRSHKYGRVTNWLDKFQGLSREYDETLDKSWFSPGEIVVSMCSQT